MLLTSIVKLDIFRSVYPQPSVLTFKGRSQVQARCLSNSKISSLESHPRHLLVFECKSYEHVKMFTSALFIKFTLQNNFLTELLPLDNGNV